VTISTDPEPQLEPEGPARPRRWPIIALSVLAVAAIVVGVVAANKRTNDSPTVAVPALPDLGGPGVPTGDPAEDFTVELIDGTIFNLDEHLATDGRPVFLNLWASWCVPCRNEMPAIQSASERWPGVYFLGVAVEDDPSAAEDFAAEIGVTYPIAIDETETVNVAFPHFGLPATFVIGQDGTIANQVFGEIIESEIDSLLAGVIG
jgi:thiol-disulfide isomerase/thioredoxin